MDFGSEALFDGRRLCLLRVIDLNARECLNENWFMSLEDARCKIEGWSIHYNQSRPNFALGWMTPPEFAEKSSGCQNMQST